MTDHFPRPVSPSMFRISRSAIAFAGLLTFLSGCSANRILREADEAFERRDDLTRLRATVAILEAAIRREGERYELLWRLTKFRSYLGQRDLDSATSLSWIDAAVESGVVASRIEPSRPEGHFWLAAAYGAQAETLGATKALLLLPSIRREYATAFELQPAYENGSALEALGELNIHLPAQYGGNRRLGIAQLQLAAELAPENSDVSLSLAKVYLASDRQEEAKALIQAVLDSRDPFKSALEQERVYQKAHQLLSRLAHAE